MTLYLDTSAFIKLYVEEDGSERVREAVEEADCIVIATVGYPEARAALARLHREGALASEDHEAVKTVLAEDWGSFRRLEVTDRLARLAGELAERHALRGFDATHLAAAMQLQQAAGDLVFLTYDRRLLEAARTELLA